MRALIGPIQPFILIAKLESNARTSGLSLFIRCRPYMAEPIARESNGYLHFLIFSDKRCTVARTSNQSLLMPCKPYNEFPTPWTVIISLALIAFNKHADNKVRTSG